MHLNVKYRIHSATVYTCVLFTLAKTISKAENLILFPYCLYRFFFFLVLIDLCYSTRFFSTYILLPSRFVKIITSKIFNFRGDTNAWPETDGAGGRGFQLGGQNIIKKGI